MKFIIVDDEEVIRDSLCGFLIMKDHSCRVASNGKKALELIDNEMVDVAISDINMPYMNGIELLKIIRSKYPEIKVILLTGHANEENAINAEHLGVYTFLSKSEKGGKLEVTLKNIEIGEDEALSQIGLSIGPYIILIVSDTGLGMSKEVMERIFDPFFTTKPIGKGTGMGLATVHGIVTSHRGKITVDSELGKGTTFKVYLPRIGKDMEATGEKLKPVAGGKERILLIDDEEILAQMEKDWLERLGYTVDMKINSIDALKAFRSNSRRFDLVITDQTMPGITGIELAREIKATRPDLPVILVTGFSHVITRESAKKAGVDEFLMKPLILRNLAEVVRQLLDKNKNR